MLRQGASPGDAQDIGLLVAELVEQVTHQGRQCGQVVRNYRWLGPADARHVEPDDFSLGVERMDERLQQLEARPDAVAQHKWRPLGVPASHRDPQAPTTGHQRAAGRARRRADGQDAQTARPLFPGPPGWSGSAVIDLAAGAGSGCRYGWWPGRRDRGGPWVRLSSFASFRNASACSADAPAHQVPGQPPTRSARRAGIPLLPAQPPGVAGGRAIRPVQLRPMARSIGHK
jgi:hypothetical protein